MNKFAWSFPSIYETAEVYKYLIGELGLSPFSVKVENADDLGLWRITIESEEPTSHFLMRALCDYILYKRVKK